MILLPTLALLTPAALLDDPAAHHAAGSVLYLEVPDVPGALDAYERTALIATLTDPALHAAIGRVIDQEGFDPIAELVAEYDAAVERGDLPPLKELLVDPLRRISFSVSAPDGQVAPLISEVLLGNHSLEWAGARLGLQFELEFESADAATELFGAFLGLMEDEGGEVEVQARGEASVAQVEAPLLDGVHFVLVRSGPHLCALFGAQTPAGYLARLSGEAPGFAAPEPEVFFGTGQTVLRYRATFAQDLLALEEAAQLGPLIELAGGMLGPVVPMLLRGGAWRIGIAEDGRIITEGLAPRATRPLDQVLASRPLEPGALDMIHPDAIVGWAAHFDPAPLLDLLEDQFAGTGGDPFETLEERYGFRPDTDLLAPLGSTLAYSLPEPKTLLAAPPLMISVGLSDRAAFERGLDGLARVLRAESRGEVQLSTSEYRGMRLDTLEIDWSQVQLPAAIPIDPSVFFKLTIAVCDERVFVTTLPSHAKREIRRLLAQDTAGGSRPNFPEGCYSVGFADWPRFLGKLYDAGRAMLPLIQLMGPGEAPFDAAGLPEAGQLLARFQPSWRWKRPHGDEWVQHFQESSFGFETNFVGLAVVSGLTLGVTRTAQMEVEDARWDAAEIRAHRLRHAIEVYRVEQGALPEVWSDLVGRQIEEEDLQADPWGGAFHFGVVDEELLVWCDGPNGLDEGGSGDDVGAR